LADFGEHGLAQGIRAFGTIERDARDGTNPLDQDGVEFHLATSLAVLKQSPPMGVSDRDRCPSAPAPSATHRR
jgi:hypothetical protein